MSGLEGNADEYESPQPRRRSFLAMRSKDPLAVDTIPVAADDDDLPVLTEVVTPDEINLPAEVPPPERSNPPADVRIEEVAAELMRAVGEQMAYELPTLIEATLLSVSEELRAGIASTMEAALREYIARRKQLSLPLDDANGEPIDGS